MNVFELTRALVDIESITGNEENVGLFLLNYLTGLATRFGGRVERMEVEPHRFNLFAQFGDRPIVTLSTHMDTVPPFFPSSEDDEFIWGRAACDTKGIIASMITAAERLLERGGANWGCCSSSAKSATALERIMPPKIRADRASSYTASPRKISWLSDRRARCATN